jgi:rhamnopyranosyl-N-acetylglucosaminyl-diphospho-decaprenol beta-1,3/1,4-galactofuranosyltransferase
MIPASTCAVVLTYNQKHYLLECLEAIASQTRPVQTIFIIDNASVDGTRETLVENGYLPDASDPLPMEPAELHQRHVFRGIPIRYVRLAENTGAAGGYADGFRRAFEAGFEWIWVSDADGLADARCLETLLQAGDQGDFLAPLLLNRGNPAELCFRLREDMRSMFSKVYTTVAEAEAAQRGGLIRYTANPWSSSLIHRRFMERVGFPKVDYFLAGEDYEYVLRGLKAGLRVATVVSARCFHPRQDKRKNDWLMYLRYRNYFDLFATHYGPAILALHLFKNLVQKIGARDLKGTLLMLRAWHAAFRKDWRLHSGLT